MQISKVYSFIALVIVVICTMLALFGLLNEFARGLPADLLIQNLEAWATESGYRLALVVLAATGVQYLANKTK